MWTVAHQAPLSMGVSKARTLEWPVMPSSRGSSQPRDRTQVSRIVGGLFTSWATREAQEYWRGQPIPSPGDLPDPGIEPGSPALRVDSLPAELPGKPIYYYIGLHTFFPLWWAQLCSSLNIPWLFLSLGLEWKLTFSSPVATAEFSKSAGILSAAL